MNWLTYLFSKTIVTTGSKYNQDIRVVEESGKYKLMVNGYRQSGEFIKALWNDAFSALGVRELQAAKRILVLGVAGGTVIHMLHSLYPHADIIGVDIDKAMIGIGKKYFGLDDLKSFTAVHDDAKHFVEHYTGVRFDCVVVDIFIGTDVPPFVQTNDFQKHIRQILNPKGFLLINYSFRTDDLSMDIGKALQAIYPLVVQHNTTYNRFFLAK